MNTLNLVKVHHLFVVPRIRSSHYAQMLVDQFPEMRSMHPGELQIEGLPSLRNFVVVDNADAARNAELERLGVRSMVDWREIPVWSPGSYEERVRKEVEGALDKDEVVNLQFTRCVLHRCERCSLPWNRLDILNCDADHAIGSGTTGLPKAVSLTHMNLLNNGINIGRCMRMTNRDLLCASPFPPQIKPQPQY